MESAGRRTVRASWPGIVAPSRGDPEQLWNDSESALAPCLVHREVPPIERKDHVKTIALGQIDERGIRKLRANTSVFFHQLSDFRRFGALNGKKFEEALRNT